MLAIHMPIISLLSILPNMNPKYSKYENCTIMRVLLIATLIHIIPGELPRVIQWPLMLANIEPKAVKILNDCDITQSTAVQVLTSKR
jgi:hypothetical protein